MNWQFPLILAQADAPPVAPGAAAPAAPPGAPASGSPGASAAPGSPVAPGSPNGAAPNQPSGPFDGFGPYMILIIVVMWLMIFLPQRREKKKQQELMNSMKKGDRVTTIGGIIGTIIEVRDDEVVVKVDEANNTRIHFRRSAIQSIGAEPANKK